MPFLSKDFTSKNLGRQVPSPSLAHLYGRFFIYIDQNGYLMQLNLTPSCNHSIITIGGNTGMRKFTIKLTLLGLTCAPTDSQVTVCPILDVELFWNAKDLLSVNLVDTNENKGAPNRIIYRVSHN